jgi:hypothetical protein
VTPAREPCARLALDDKPTDEGLLYQHPPAKALLARAAGTAA